MKHNADNESEPEDEVDGDNGAGVDAAVATPSEDANALGYIPDNTNASLGDVRQDGITNYGQRRTGGPRAMRGTEFE